MLITSINLNSDVEKIKQVTELAFASTPDANLNDWFSMDELKRTIAKDIGICLKAVDGNGKLIGTIHAMQENPINGQEGEEKWIIRHN